MGKDDKGRFIPKNVPGTEKVLPTQLILLAMGFLGPEQPLLDALGIERDARTNARAESEKYTTNVKGVFAAGDCRRGQSLVVWAFNEGRGAARECDRYLMGTPICRNVPRSRERERMSARQVRVPHFSFSV